MNRRESRRKQLCIHAETYTKPTPGRAADQGSRRKGSNRDIQTVCSGATYLDKSAEEFKAQWDNEQGHINKQSLFHTSRTTPKPGLDKVSKHLDARTHSGTRQSITALPHPCNKFSHTRTLIHLCPSPPPSWNQECKHTHTPMQENHQRLPTLSGWDLQSHTHTHARTGARAHTH